MKPGLSLIELIIALFISSVISLALYNSFSVTNRIFSRSQSIVELDMNFAVLYNQLDKDISGIFVPLQVEEKITPTTSPTKKENVPLAKNENDQNKEAPKKAPKIEHIFYAKNKDKSINLLTFISSNPATHYIDAPNTRVSPRMVRIVYRLVPEDPTAKSFKIVRQESENLDLKAFDLSAAKPIRAYEIANNIRAWSGKYEYSLKKTEGKKQSSNAPADKQQAPQEKPKEILEFHTLASWEEPEDKASTQPKIPEYIIFILEIWNNKDQTSSTAQEMIFSIPSYQPKTVEPEKQDLLVKKETTVAFTYNPNIFPTPPNVQEEIERHFNAIRRNNRG